MNRPIRVAVDQNDEPWTSQRTYINNLIGELQRDDRVRLVSRDDSPDVYHLNYLNPLGRLVHGKRDHRRHLRDVLSVIAGLDAAVVLTEHGVEEFSDLRHSMYLDDRPAVSRAADVAKRGLSRIFGNRADHIIAISSMDRKFLIEHGFRQDGVSHVPHGVDRSFFPSDIVDDGYVLHVSKCSPHKNPEAVIEVGREIDTRMIVVGGGWREQYGSAFAAIDSVELKGFVDKSELRRLYAEAGVFYFPSTYEPFGFPILESMASGTPVIASSNSAARDFDTDGVETVQPDATDRHIERLESLLRNPDERRRRGELARSFAERMTWERTADRTIDIYQNVC